MLYKIARKIKTDYISTLSFADRTGGLVRIMNDHRKDERSYPVENNQDKVLGDNQYMRRLIPNSDKKSVMYFELGSTPTVVEEHNMWSSYEAQLKLVCWFNYQEVDPDMYDPAYLIAEINNAIPFKIGSFECLTVVTCKFAGQDGNSGDIFTQYTYNEPESQFFKYPYEYFVMNFDISYRVVANCYEEGLADVPVDPVLLTFKGVGSRTVYVYGVSGKEYQLEAYIDGGVHLIDKTLHEFSGENQTYTFDNTGILGTLLMGIDYGREYIRGIDASSQEVNNITIPDDDNIRLEYVDLSDNAITVEAYLIALIDHLYDTDVNGGTLDISGGTNAAITDLTALAQVADMIATRDWTITTN